MTGAEVVPRGIIVVAHGGREVSTDPVTAMQPAAKRYGLVARLGADGQITRSLHGPAGRFREIVGVRQHDGWLYLGSLYETAVGRVPLPA